MSFMEVNGNALIAGDMDAGDGTFAGTFAADNIGAVQSINIRDGAVTATTFFNLSSEQTDFTFYIDPPDTATAIELIIPIRFRYRYSGYEAVEVPIDFIRTRSDINFYLYRNDQLISHSVYDIVTFSDKGKNYTDTAAFNVEYEMGVFHAFLPLSSTSVQKFRLFGQPISVNKKVTRKIGDWGNVTSDVTMHFTPYLVSGVACHFHFGK